MIKQIRDNIEAMEDFIDTIIFNFTEYRGDYSLEIIRDVMIASCEDFINSVYKDFITDEDA